MKHKNLSRLRRTISGILALTMTASIFSAVPASADVEVGSSKTYYGDGYNVKYDVTSVWGDHSNVNVTLTNTGEEAIRNWALKYDTDGDIENIWNGVVFDSDEGYSIIKNAGYNYEIAPDGSISFGYTVVSADDLPESIVLSSERRDFDATDYSVTLNVENDWGTGFTGNIAIEAIGDKPIEAWRLSFDANFDLSSVWNASLLGSENNSYTVDSTYATAFIQPGETVSFGLCGIKDNDIIPEINNISINGVVVDGSIDNTNIPDSSEDDSISDSSSENYSSDNLEDNSSHLEDSSSQLDDSYQSDSSEADDSSDIQDDSSQSDSSENSADSSEEDNAPVETDAITVTAFGKYNVEENAIDIEWQSNISGDYEVLVSDDNEKYESLINENTFTSYRYHIENDFETKYFKVRVTSDNKYADSIPFIVKKNGNGYSVVPIDSDEDGIFDIIEIGLGTDVNKPDTDDDGLTDYQEVAFTFTDPLVYDSLVEGVADAEADTDSDGLSNVMEMSIGTNPIKADTDKDNLSDGDEVNKYGTDPLDPDTDDDGLLDGDEVAVGLDPLSGATDGGVSDKDRKIEQHINENSEVFEEVNTSDNPFKVSIDITAAGNAETALTAKESGYSDIISNDAVLGIIPEFNYADGLAVDDVVLNFDVDSSYTENTNGKYSAVSDNFKGIKRFNVFKYFEEFDMLMPIETTYDLNSNTVSTHVDELGTYCIVDMEKWFDSLGIDPEKFDTTIVSSNVVSALGIGIPRNLIAMSGTPEIEDRCLDVVFNVFINKSTKDKASAQVLEAGKKLFEEYGENSDLRIYIVDYKGRLIEPPTTTRHYAANISDLEYMSNHIYYRAAGDEPFIEDAAIKFLNSNYLRTEADKYYVSIQHDVVESKTQNMLSQLLNRFLKEEITVCVVSNTKMTDTQPLAVGTGGIYYSENIYKYADPVVDHIIDFHKKKGKGETYKTISAAGWKVIALEEPIVSDYRTLAINGVPEEDRFNYADQDNDGLLDLEELRYYFDDVEAISWDNDGKVQLMTFADCMSVLPAKSYIQNALDQYEGWDTSFMDEWRILPIYSDPTDEDSDSDGLVDGLEIEIGTKVLNTDTDKDGLSDGKEVLEWFDPLCANSDGDSYDDRMEYVFGQDPFTYDLDVEDWLCEFTIGFSAGDFADPDYIATMLGQITSGFLPIVADARDVVANLSKKEWGNALLSGVGLVPAAGDAIKIAGNLGQFITKHADEAGQVLDSFRQVVNKIPAAGFALSEKCIESVKDAVKKSSRLTRNSYDEAKTVLTNIDEFLSEDVSKAKHIAEKAAGKIDAFADIAKRYGNDIAEYVKNLPKEKADKLSRILTKPSSQLDDLIKNSKDINKIIDFLGDFGDDGAAALSTLSKHSDEIINLVRNNENSKLALKAINAYKETAINALNKVNTKQCAEFIIRYNGAAEVISEHSDDAIKIIESSEQIKTVDSTILAIQKRGQNAVAAFKNATPTKDCSELIIKYADDATEVICSHGDEAVKAVANCDSKHKALKIIRNGGTQYGEQATQAIKKSGDKAVEALTKVPSKECAEKIINHGDFAAIAISEHGEDAYSYVEKIAPWKTKQQPSYELYMDNKSVYDDPNYFNQTTGEEYWPGENGDINKDGFINGQYEDIIIRPEDNIVIDRYGSNYGTFFGEDGTPIEMRAMSPNSDFNTYNRYKVNKNLPMRKGIIKDWFGQPGGGIQFKLDPEFVSQMMNKAKNGEGIIDVLIKEGYMEVL